MKKLVVTICALATLVGAVSCHKEEERVPEYAEGVYNPVMQLGTVALDGAVVESYTWTGETLSTISYNDGSSVNYVYENGKIAKVVANVSGSEEVRYRYEGDQMAGCEIYYGDTKVIDMAMQHNAEGKINASTITIDQDLLASMGDVMGKGTVVEKVLGREVTETLVKMAKVAALDSRKLAITGQNITMNLDWNGDNVATQYLAATINVTLSSSDISSMSDIFELPEEVQELLPIIDWMGGLPLTISLCDTVTATYDNYYNPYFCNWGGMASIDVENPNLLNIFSLNNILTVTNNGTIAIGMSLGNETQDLFSQPIVNKYDEYTYLYNDKKYPTEKQTTEGTFVYTYKN